MYYRDPWGKSECVSTHSYLPNIWAGHNKRTDTAPFEDQNNFLLKTGRMGKKHKNLQTIGRQVLTYLKKCGSVLHSFSCCRLSSKTLKQEGLINRQGAFFDNPING